MTDIATSEDTTAPYGSACAACYRAKCRCVVREQGGRCERCHRLDKPCQPHASSSKRRLKPSNNGVRAGRVSKSPAGLDTDTTRIERKLDDLVSMLSTPSTAANSSTTRSESVSARTKYPQVTATEAEESLAAFTTHMLKFFPYVHVPPTTTATELCAQRPFLVLCMAAVTTRPAERQRQLLEMIRETVANQMIIKSEPSIDMLLGLITFLSWLSSTYLAHSVASTRTSMDGVKSAVSVFSRLTVAMVNDLGLNLPMLTDPPHMRCFHMLHAKGVAAEHRTMEERRAVLACYVLQAGLPRGDGLRWTAHMSESLELLETAQESSMDAMLVQQVKTYRVVEKANVAASYHATFEASGNSSTLPLVYMQSMLGDLDAIKRALPSRLQQDAIASAFDNTARLQIRCMAVSWPDLGPQQQQQQANLAQLKNLSACVDLIERALDDFFAIPLVDYVGIPFTVFSQLKLSFGMLFVLSTLDCPWWDKFDVRRQIDLLTTINRLIDGFRQAATLYVNSFGNDGEDSMMARMVSHLGFMRSAFAASIEQSDGGAVQAAMETPESIGDVGGIDMPDIADFLDMEWLMSAM